jgi:GNAT superfamily N-acetyltransferase
MASLEIKPVETRRERKRFLMLPWQLYRDDPNWIPPLRQVQAEMVNYRKHPFYIENEIQTFLASRDGRPCGRIAAIINHGHNRRYQERRGFFGFFETIDDEEVSAGLFDAVRDWLAERDIRAIRGPCNPSLNYELGLLIDGFDTPPTFMMTYNPPHYERHVEAYGFQKTQDLYAFWGHIDMLDKLDRKLWFVTEESIRRFDITTRRFDKSRFHEDVRSFLKIYNGALDRTWGHVPMTDAEVNHTARSMRFLLVPEMTTAAIIDGEPIGSCFGMLDYNPRIKAINGRLFPFGFLRLLWNRRAIKRVRLIATTVLPQYQMMGVGVVLLARILKDAIDWGIEEGEFSWVLESNHLSCKTLQRGGAKITKTYRLYDYGPGEKYAAADPDQSSQTGDEQEHAPS